MFHTLVRLVCRFSRGEDGGEHDEALGGTLGGLGSYGTSPAPQPEGRKKWNSGVKHGEASTCSYPAQAVELPSIALVSSGLLSAQLPSCLRSEQQKRTRPRVAVHTYPRRRGSSRDKASGRPENAQPRERQTCRLLGAKRNLPVVGRRQLRACSGPSSRPHESAEHRSNEQSLCNCRSSCEWARCRAPSRQTALAACLEFLSRGIDAPDWIQPM
ncbi:hypothetical protein B0H63DRAFT_305131 [Podospora didyma]|uniref:Uncharacterized protein n=1 Tax=Podospora didyma TaxID=330526 RepID=A0AAE0K4N7_9PEZI|nr:hypothetical protein B0H63DRAFT_305131 [Podospora didyma]